MPHVDDRDSAGNPLDANDLIAAARKLWGKETARRGQEWRFGRHESKSIRLDKLVWRDHETDEDGGIIELCRRAGINGWYHTGATGKPREDEWEPGIPPGEAPINLLTCDRLFTYRTLGGEVSHYVRRFERPRKFLPLTWGVLNGREGWHPKAPKPPLDLYRLADLRELDPELVLLCEGEKAADATNERIWAENLPWLAMSWYGGAGRARDADVSVLAGRRVAIWPDADKAGLKAAAVLLEKIPEAAVLEIEGLADGFDAADLGAGVSIKAFVEGRMGVVEVKPAQPAKPAAGKDELPPDISIDDFYAYLPKHLYLYIPTQQLWPPATIGSRLGKKDGMRAARWLDKHKAVSQQVWAPGAPQIVRDKHLIEGGWYPKPGAIIFNQYREPMLEGGDPDKAGPWLDLLKFLYPNPIEHGHIIRVLAFKAQHPEIKIMHAIVLGGGMRIGKDTILMPVRRMFGSWNCKEAKPSDIMGIYNPYMKSIILIVNETRDLGEIKKYHFYDHMKTVIATPPEVVPLNDKYEKAVQVLNICLVIMTTNYRTDGLYLPPGDARHFPVWSTVQKEDFDIDFFTKHYAWLNHGGVAHVAAHLRSIDVSDFDPGRHPPITDMFNEIVDANRPPETSMIEDILDAWAAASGQRPNVFVLSSLIIRAEGQAKEWLANPANRKSIPYRLDDCGYTRIPNPSVADGRWMVGGIKQNVYGNKHLTTQERLEEARSLR